jgi:uncharacterized circularly permuted ATP-grasp superfamily protein/uncharacterized alpha-E superfamily protein
LPIVLEGQVFRWLAKAVAERFEALELVLDDLYGERRLIADGVVPGELLAASDRYRLDAIGLGPRRWLTSYAVDLAVRSDGAWCVVHDHTEAPSGLGYALLGRSVMARVWPDAMPRAEVAPLGRFAGPMRRALASVSTATSPRTVVFSAGLDHPSYVDQSYLAVQLGLNLVEGADLVVRRRRVFLRTLDGLEPVDVLYRRLDAPTIDPLIVGAHDSVGVPGLLQAVRSGGVTLANAHGAGAIEVPGLEPYLDAAIELVRPQQQAVGRLPVGATLARAPYVDPRHHDGVDDAAVVVRLHAVRDDDGITVLPGGTGRVLYDGDDPRLPSRCLAKDVWVVDHRVPVARVPRLPQIDLGRSVPTRAADALYWMNRSAERAEAMTRTLRVVASWLEHDNGLAALHEGAWARRAIAMLASARRGTPEPDGAPPSADDLREALSDLADAVGREVGVLLTEATTVREFLSVTAGRVLLHLADLRSAIADHTVGAPTGAPVDALDEVLGDFGALAGLWQESTVRGPAWQIGDTGRRFERCLVVLDLVEAACCSNGEARRFDPDDEVDAAMLETLLAANDSLVAYRRRHRSEVEIEAALALLVRDRANPRSIAASLDRLELHGTAADGVVTSEFIDEARAALDLPLVEMIATVRELVSDAVGRLIGQWFSTPVNPIAMRETEGAGVGGH